MNRKIELIKNSIKHWERLRDGKEPATHSQSKYCPLCNEYYKDDCKGCPIIEFMGRTGCLTQPWVLYLANPSPENAQKEVCFLNEILLKEMQSKIG